MSESNTQIYEGMFLFPPNFAADLQSAVDHLHELFQRADAELLALQKWDERRIAYEIKGHKRGVYLLAYFRAPTAKMAGLERDCNLSEMLLRAMCVRADHVPAEEIAAADQRGKLADEIAVRGREQEESAAGASS